MFRGFLLPSLARYMPVNAALVLSSVVFGVAHCSWQRFLPLVMLGLLMGTVYIRTRNLLTPVALHAFWNVYIFWRLLAKGWTPLPF